MKTKTTKLLLENLFASRWHVCPDCLQPHDGHGVLIDELPDDAPGILDKTIPCLACRCISPEETRRAALLGASLFFGLMALSLVVLAIGAALK